MREIHVQAGSSIEMAHKELVRVFAETGEVICCKFNNAKITSLMTLDECYIAVVGHNKAEHDRLCAEEKARFIRFNEQVSIRNLSDTYLFDKGLSLEEKGLLALIIDANKVRKPDDCICVGELAELNPRSEREHVAELIERLYIKGLLRKEMPQ